MTLEHHPAESFVNGILRGGLVGILAIFAAEYVAGFWPWLDDHRIWRFAGTALLSTLVTLTRPLLLRTVLCARRSPFVLESDLDQALMGRAIGVAAGIFFGILMIVMPN